MTFTNYTETEILQWLVGGQDMPASHSSVYVSLHSSDPGESPDGSTEIDASTFTYERTETTAGSDWTIADDTFENSSEISFPEADSNWGTITHFAIWDGASDSDNPLAKSALEISKEVKLGDKPIFRVGKLSGQID